MQIDTVPKTLSSITAQSLMGQYRSKREIFNLLTTECGYYLPNYRQTNIYFFKQIINCQKKALKCKNLRYIYAPQYDSLTVEKILEFACKHREIDDYLPQKRDLATISRQWILNVANTVLGDKFTQFVKSAVENRHQKIADRSDKKIEIDPEILAVIKSSNSVSTEHGNSAHLLKVGSKRRRTKQEMDEYRQLQEDQLNAIAERDAQIEELHGQLSKSKQKIQSGEYAESLVQQMIDQEALILKDDGTYTLADK